MSRVLVLLVCIIAGQFVVNSQTQEVLDDDDKFSCQTKRPDHEWEILYRTRPTGTIKSPCYGDSNKFPNELPSGYKLVYLNVPDREVIGYDLLIVDFNITARNRLYIGNRTVSHGPLKIAHREWTMISDDLDSNVINFYYMESDNVSFTKEIGDTVRFNFSSLYMDYYTVDNTDFVKGFWFNYTTVDNDTSTTEAPVTTPIITTPVITTPPPTTPVITTPPPTTTDISPSTPGTTSSVTTDISSPTTGSKPPSSTKEPATSSTDSTSGASSTTTTDAPPSSTISNSTISSTTDITTTTSTPPCANSTSEQLCFVDCGYYTATIVLGVLLAIAIWLIIVLAVILIRKNGFCCSCSSVGACLGNVTPCVNCCQEES